MAVSQAQHPEIFRKVSSEKEGMKLIKNTVAFLIKQRRPWLVFKLFTDCVAKYAGYLLGRKYQKLPKKDCIKMHNESEILDINRKTGLKKNIEI